MKAYFILILLLIITIPFLNAEESSSKKVFSKKDILRLADVYINNNVKVNNPAIVDVDSDGDFDILEFTKKGKVEYYKNTGTIELPFFVLENKNFDKYEVNSLFNTGMPVPVFFADKDGDNDADVFGIVKEESNKYKVVYIENTADLDHYTLITIILVLVIVLLLVLILK